MFFFTSVHRTLAHAGACFHVALPSERSYGSLWWGGVRGTPTVAQIIESFLRLGVGR
jgi:hypothetical protein